METLKPITGFLVLSVGFLGLLLLGDGLSGMMTAETCCSETSCPVDNRCGYTVSNVEHQGTINPAVLLLGIFLITGSLLTHKYFHK